MEKQDYYIQDNKIIIEGNEISFELLEMAFLETILKYREKKAGKIIKFEPIKKEENEEDVSQNMCTVSEINFSDVIQFESGRDIEQEENERNEAIRIMNTYKLDREGLAKSYLYDIRESFRDIACESIISLYNILENGRKNRMFKSNVPLIDENNRGNKSLIKFAYMLLSFYPIQFYAKEKEIIDYSSLLIPNITSDANYYRYDDTCEEFEKKFERINNIIDSCMIFVRSRRVRESEKRRVRFQINQLEWEKRELEAKYMEEMLSQTDMREVFNDDTEESFYTSRTLNKHILYNIENALRNGHVDIRTIHGKTSFVFYSVYGDDVDFILSIDSNKMIDVIDSENLMESLIIEDSQSKRMLIN